MGRQRLTCLIAALSAVMFLAAAPTSAQVTGTGIAGVVRDSSGGVLPGVTVEAASPALIEKVRTAVTDGEGAYLFVDLRPGSYTVTFTLPGFSTFRRDGITLAGGNVATVNAQLSVGALEETITVTGEAPVVDTRTATQQTSISIDTLATIPGTGRLSQMVAVLPGATLENATLQNVGGVNDRTQTAWSMHGAPGADIVMDGSSQSVIGGGAATYIFNNLTFQEVVVEMSGTSAERATGGVQMNIIPKDGGNTLSGMFTTSHAGAKLESKNIDDALRARGLQPTPGTKKIYDTGGGVGGPFRRDHLWFYGAFRTAVNQQYGQGNYYNKVHGTLFGQQALPGQGHLYEPDLSRQAFTNEYTKDYSLRITWQVAPKHKVVLAHSVQPNCNCSYQILNQGTLNTPEYAGQHHYNPNGLPSANWTYPATSRLLFEAGLSMNIFTNQGKRQDETGHFVMPITDTGLRLRYGSRGNQLGNNGGSYTMFRRRTYNSRFTTSYITGSHAFKAGLNVRHYALVPPSGGYNDNNQINQARDFTFRNQRPQSVRIWAIPHGVAENARDVAFFVQDQWTVERLTLNLGVRYNDFNAWTPEQTLPAGPWVPERRYEATKEIPHWRNLNPRFGVAYDLLGTGRTALKGALGRYNPGLSATTSNPALNQAHSTSRTWNDANGNYIPDCDLLNPVAHGECGPWSDLGFGKPRVVNLRNAPDSLEGFNMQEYNWQASASIQHELRPNLALNVGYFRTWYGGFLATDNQAVDPADYDEYCITVPVDNRLPNSGQQLCGLYDLRPNLFGQVDNLVTQASHYGERSEVYNGVDVTLSGRFGQGGQASGGVSVGRTVADNCVIVDSPEAAREGFCGTARPWDAATQVKFLVIYPLPWGLHASAVYQNVPGIPITATYEVRNAEIAPSLGRNLGSCRGAAVCNATAEIELIPNQTLFEDRLQQVDLRFGRMFRLGGTARLQANFDLNNLFNANNPLNINTGYGGSWLDVRQILAGRLIKLGVQFDF